MLSVVIAFSVMLYTTASTQVTKTRALNDALLSKAAVDALADQADFVYLSGEGSVIYKEIFISPNSNCFYESGTSNAFYCTISNEYLRELSGPSPNPLKEKVYSRELTVPLQKIAFSANEATLCSPLAGGWVKVNTSNYGGVVSVSCIKLP